MGFIKRLIIKDGFKRVMNGVIDAVPVAATIKQNIESQPNRGKIDWLRLTVTLVTVGLIIAYVKGWITMDELKQLLKLFN